MDIARYIWHKFKEMRQEIKNEKLFNAEFDQFSKMAAADPRLPVPREEAVAYMNERTRETPFDASYVYHTAWAARILARTRPARHVDISSYMFFNTMVSAFIPIDFYEFQPTPLKLSNLTPGRQDLTNLTFADNSIPSLSCMHVVEHIGLGRYGDPLDAGGDVKATRELKRVLAPGGLLLFVVPSGRCRVVFNAHRVYGYKEIMSLFEGLTLEEFSLLPDNFKELGLIENASPDLVEKQWYGCGCYAFRKPVN